jgi:hypothetical protein
VAAAAVLFSLKSRTVDTPGCGHSDFPSSARLLIAAAGLTFILLTAGCGSTAHTKAMSRPPRIWRGMRKGGASVDRRGWSRSATSRSSAAANEHRIPATGSAPRFGLIYRDPPSPRRRGRRAMSGATHSASVRVPRKLWPPKRDDGRRGPSASLLRMRSWVRRSSAQRFASSGRETRVAIRRPFVPPWKSWLHATGMA